MDIKSTKNLVSKIINKGGTNIESGYTNRLNYLKNIKILINQNMKTELY